MARQGVAKRRMLAAIVATTVLAIIAYVSMRVAASVSRSWFLKAEVGVELAVGAFVALVLLARWNGLRGERDLPDAFPGALPAGGSIVVRWDGEDAIALHATLESVQQVQGTFQTWVVSAASDAAAIAAAYRASHVSDASDLPPVADSEWRIEAVAGVAFEELGMQQLVADAYAHPGTQCVVGVVASSRERALAGEAAHLRLAADVTAIAAMVRRRSDSAMVRAIVGIPNASPVRFSSARAANWVGRRAPYSTRAFVVRAANTLTAATLALLSAAVLFGVPEQSHIAVWQVAAFIGIVTMAAYMRGVLDGGPKVPGARLRGALERTLPGTVQMSIVLIGMYAIGLFRLLSDRVGGPLPHGISSASWTAMIGLLLVSAVLLDGLRLIAHPRRRRRVARLEVQLDLHMNGTPATALDLSAYGARVVQAATELPELGSTVGIELALRDTSELISARVRRAQREGDFVDLGLEFEEMTPQAMAHVFSMLTTARANANARAECAANAVTSAAAREERWSVSEAFLAGAQPWTLPVPRAARLATSVLIVGLVAAMLPIAQPTADAAPVPAQPPITGSVFRDYNQNGAKDNVATQKDTGQIGIDIAATCVTDSGPDNTVGTADDVQATSATVTSDINGSYTLPVPGSPCRVEASIPSSKSYLRPSAGGGSLVQFVNGGGTADFALTNPADYCQNTPKYFVNCFIFGAPTGIPTTVGGQVEVPGVIAAPTLKTDFNDVGATYGMAIQKDFDGAGANEAKVFSSSFIRRHSGVKDHKTAAIYVRDASATGASMFLDLDTLLGANVAGIDPHPLTVSPTTYTIWVIYPIFSITGYRCTYGGGTVLDYGAVNPGTCYFNDPSAMRAVGKRGLGDLDISEDGKTLYTVNLETRELYAVPVGYPAVAPTSAASIGRFAIPTGACSNAADARPFGLGVRDGTVFVGGTCSGENVPTELSSWIYEFQPGASATAGTFGGLVWGPAPLPAPKDDSYWTLFGISCSGTWQAWTNFIQPDCGTVGVVHTSTHATAMMTDITFDGSDLAFSLADRYGYQLGNGSGGLAADIVNQYTTVSSGYIQRACRNAADTAWISESAGACGGVTGAGTASWEIGNGPGGGQFYHQKRWMDTSHTNNYHGGILASSLAQAGGNPLAAGETDTTTQPFANGLGTLSNLNGSRMAETSVISGGTGTPGFGKANGLGDLEALCDKAPVEIGNRLWIDGDGDGTQDPGEAPVSGATVNLYADTDGNGAPDGAAIATVTTDAQGNYLFSSDPNRSSVPAAQYGLSALGYDPLVPANNQFLVRVPTTVPDGSGGILELTQRDATTDSIDSDASQITGLTSTITVTGTGHNDHRYDAGYTPLYSIGNQVFFDANNDGDLDAGPEEYGLSSVTVRIHVDRDNNNIPDSDAFALAFEAAHPGVSTNGTGYYLFTGLPAGNYIISVETPSGMQSSTGVQDGGTAPNTTFEGALLNDVDVVATDGDDNGSDVDGVPGGTVRSRAITLGGTPEPTGEPATPGWTDESPAGNPTPDANGNYTVDFGFFTPLSLGNVVWEDTNNNGVRDGGESGIPAATVTLYADADGNGIPDGPALQTVDTDATGHYSFHGLGAGTYVVEVIPPASGNYRSSTGTAGAYETAVPDPDNDVDSDDNGADLDGLPGGAVRSKPITLAAGTEPAGETDRAINDPNGRLTDPSTDEDGNYTLDFGFFVAVSVGNQVWDDADDDGILDLGETGVDGVTVRLFDGGGTEIPVGPDGILGTADDAVGGMVTSGGGYYLFDGLAPGSYQIEFVVPAGYRTSSIAANTPDADINNDNDAAAPKQVGTVRTGTVNLTAGSEPTNDGDSSNTSNLAVDLGIFNPDPSMQIRKFTNGCDAQLATGATRPTAACPADDGNNNPVIAEGGAVTWTYRVENTGNVPLTNIVVTDDQGVTVSCPGTSLPASPAGGPAPSMVCTASGVATAGQYTNNGLLNADAEQVPGGDPSPLTEVSDISHYFGTDPGLSLKKYTLTADPGDPATPGWTPPATTVVDDADVPTGVDASGNHVVSQGTAIWWLYELRNTGNVELSTVTLTDDEEGAITCPADTIAAGSSLWCVKAGTATDTGQYVNVATANAVDAVTDPTTPVEVGEVTDPSAYYVPTPDIALKKYTNTLDATGDADDNPGHTLNQGSAITWTYSVRNTGDIALVDVTITDDLEGPICVIAGPLLPGATASCTHNGTATKGTYRNVGSVIGTPVPVEGDPLPQPTDSNPSGYVGVVAAIGDYVWEDMNANGIQEPDEPPVAGVVVTLLNAGGSVVATMTTDAAGHYHFSDLDPGVYQVRFAPPAGYVVTTANAGNDALDSDATSPTLTTALTDLVGGEDDLTWDLGLYRPASLGDTVWYDDNDNGLQDAGEGPVAGVTVRLYRANGELVATTTTDSAGNYRFDNLRPGSYVVEFVAPDGAVFARQNTGDDAADSDADSTTGQTGVATLRSGQHDPTWDAGIVRLSSLGDRVWWDTNTNGLQDGGEPGVPGMRVVLLGADGTIIAETRTDADGNYRFDDLRPGTYVVWFAEIPVNRIFTGRNAGSAVADSNADPASGRTAPIQLDAGVHDPTIDAGIYNPKNPGDTQVAGDGALRAVTETTGGGTAAPSGRLPNTGGAGTIQWIAIGVASLLTGSVMLSGRRRRRMA